MNSLIFPFTIHSDAIVSWQSPIANPNNGSTFGWRRVFHIKTSRKNLYIDQHQLASTHIQRAVGTHARDLTKPTGDPQNLDCNMATSVFTLPHVGVLTVVQRSVRLIVEKWDLQ